MIQPSMFYRLTEWIDRREALRLGTAKGSHVIDGWRWCNVNRCEDRETKWIFKNVIGEMDGDPTLWFNLVIARFINWHPTLAELLPIYHWNEDRFCSLIRRRMLAKEKVYTGAYMIRAGTGEDALLTKERYLCKRVFTPLWERRNQVPASLAPTCNEWDRFFSKTFGMGDFMRNQVITDMKYSRHLPMHRTLDWSTFILAGPGTCRGLCRLHGEPIKTERKTAKRDLIELRDTLVALYCENPYLVESFRDLNNVSNCMCEFDKFMRLLNGEGTPRSRYTPSKSPLP